MRGYNYLKKTNQVGLIRNIKNDLVDYQFANILGKESKSFFGAGMDQAERITRQFLLQRNAYLILPKAILYSFGKELSPIVHPLPKEWQDLLDRHGLRVNRWMSTLFWAGYVFLYWGYGILIFTKLLADSSWLLNKRQTRRLGRFAYFDSLSFRNLPQPDINGRCYDIFSWYSRWDGRARNICALCHGIKGAQSTTVDNINVDYIGQPYQPLKSIRAIIFFAAWGFKAILIAALDACLGRWWHALLLAESAKSKLVQLSGSESLAVDYLFHYSSTIYRPMWTYDAELRGSRIVCYFYSASEQVKLPTGYESQRYEWGAASWPMYLVWDKYQSTLLSSEIEKPSNIEVVGPIWFESSSQELPMLPEKSIAVFDIQPVRKSVHFGFTTLAEFISKYPDAQIRFLEDICSVFSELDIAMVYKKKREIGNRAAKEYLHLIKKISLSEHVFIVHPDISAIKVIEHSKGIISMPFTSTALYLRDQGIPSAYYDPTGWIQKDDRGAHGIPILSGRNELRAWLNDVFGDLSVENSCISADPSRYV